MDCLYESLAEWLGEKEVVAADIKKDNDGYYIFAKDGKDYKEFGFAKKEYLPKAFQLMNI